MKDLKIMLQASMPRGPKLGASIYLEWRREVHGGGRSTITLLPLFFFLKKIIGTSLQLYLNFIYIRLTLKNFNQTFQTLQEKSLLTAVDNSKFTIASQPSYKSLLQLIVISDGIISLYQRWLTVISQPSHKSLSQLIWHNY